MAYTGVVDFDTDFVCLRGFDFDVFDREVFACFPGYGSLGRRVNSSALKIQWRWRSPRRMYLASYSLQRAIISSMTYNLYGGIGF